MKQTNDDHNGGKRLRLAIMSVTISMVFAVIVVEIAVRIILPYNSPETVREHSIQYVPTIFARNLLKPMGRLVDVDKRKAWGDKQSNAPSDKLFFISDRGYRGPSFQVRKPDDITRIIIVGGSAVFDQNVWDTKEDNKKTWPHLVEKRLHQQGFASVEVINAGVPGHASADSLGRLYSQLWLYEPDIVLVYQGWNDIKYWGKARITPEKPLISHVDPYDPTANPFTSYRGSLDRLLSSSQIYTKVRNRYFSWKLNVGPEGLLSTGKESRMKDEYSKFGPRQFRLNMELIVSASRVMGAKSVLISQSTLVANNNSDEDLSKIGFDYQSLTHAAIIQAYEDTYKVIRDVAGSTDAGLIDAAVLMNGTSEYFSDHVHTSPTGSAKLAEIVSNSLVTILAESSSMLGKSAFHSKIP